MRALAGQRVLILGWGQIARRLAALLAPFDLQVTALRRRLSVTSWCGSSPPSGLDDGAGARRSPRESAARRRRHEGVRQRRADRALPAGASFYNVGRGSTVDQAALIAALESGHLGAAWLDVTEPEPLPPDHPLWRTPRCYITPHLAGGQADERGHQVRHFLDNLARFTDGHPCRSDLVT